MEDIELPVFDEGPPAVIIQQPLSQNISSTNERRRIEVSVIERNFSNLAFISGLDLMLDVNRFIIQQTIELSDLTSSLSSECRYNVKLPHGDTIYFATESSSSAQRTFYGSSRAFSIRLFDRTQQEVVQFKRRLACGNCTFLCYLQEMEVWLPPGQLVGIISQNTKLLKSSFNVYNTYREVMFQIHGPNSFGCILGKGQNFQIYSSDGKTQIGSIIYQWDQVQVTYNLLLEMPGNIDILQKITLLGAAFLLEYMYFQSTKGPSYCKCMC